MAIVVRTAVGTYRPFVSATPIFAAIAVVSFFLGWLFR
jgi:hypothetical protein